MFLLVPLIRPRSEARSPALQRAAAIGAEVGQPEAALAEDDEPYDESPDPEVKSTGRCLRETNPNMV